MYIRRTQTANRKRGGKYFTYRLVRSDRVGNSVRQTTLLNLGADFTVPQKHWKELCAIIDARLAGRSWLMEPTPELASVAEGLVRQLRAHHPSAQAAATDDDTATVRIGAGVEVENFRSAGCERLALAALQQLGLEETLGARGVSSSDARLACVPVIARMVRPPSANDAHEWLATRSATFELLGISGRKEPNRRKLQQIGYLLRRHRQALEERFFARERELLGLPDAPVFCDLTNTFGTGSPQLPLAGGGRSAQTRDDCSQVTLALLLDAEGFPRHADILPGTVAGRGALPKAIRRLEALDGSRTVTVVMDARTATPADLNWLQRRGYHWITVRHGGVTPPERKPDATVPTRADANACVWRLETGEGQTALRVWSEGIERKDNAVLVAQCARFERSLSALHAGLTRKNHIKRLERVEEQVERLRQRHWRVHRQYDIHVEPGEKGHARAVHWSRNALPALRDRQADHYRLQTSHTEWGLETVVRTYRKLTEIKRTFRDLTPEMDQDQIWRDKAAHLFVSVLAYHAVHLLRARLQAKGIHDSWPAIRNRLDNWRRITITLPSTGRSAHALRIDTEPDSASLEVARALGISSGGTRKHSCIRR